MHLKTLFFLLLVSCGWYSKAGAQASPDPNFYIYLLMGQSNMAGRGAITEQYQNQQSPRVWMLNKESAWVQAKHPLHFDKPAVVGVGPGLAFGLKMAEAHPGANIGLVPCAVGGTAIERWEPGAFDASTNTHPYDDALLRIKEAMKKGVIKGVIWHQGESNSARPEGYMEKLTALIERVRKEVGNPRLPFVAGELGRYQPGYAPISNLIKQLPDRVAATAVVTTEGLVHKGDTIHFDAPSATLLGERYAARMLQLEAAGTKTGAAPKKASAQRRPNIIFILTDDMGYGDISCFNGNFKTPHVDQLAREGRKFTHYYSPSPICSPSRTGFLTGMSPAKWNITSFLQKRIDNRRCEQADFLTLKAPSIARILRENGYATGHFGKWHMGGGRDVKDAPSIHAYGFDAYNSTWESPDPDPLITATDWIWSDKDSIKRWERTGYFVDKTLAFLASHREQPCFINLWPDDVHTPWVPGDERTGKYPADRESEVNFRAVLEEYDRQIGRLLEGIKRLGIENNTLIIFTSDNGPLPSFKGSRSAGLRGSKLSLYEGGTRMPFIAWWPGHIKPGTHDSTSVLCGTDLLPSFCQLAGVPLPASVRPDGEDRSAALLGTPSARKKPLFWEYGRNDSSFNYPKGRDRSPNIALREGKWKLLMNASGTDLQLYDLEADPYETNNVAGQHVQVAAGMEKKLLAWRRALPSLPAQNTLTPAAQ